ncbi:hypothetical protein V8G54_001753 [Vigna mungo]|uniref:Uncharacterized protein n=1 Tax=Vigna mungo TaxID=3915 RepID=A0AAQ3SC45_VIGMU
MKFDRRKRKSRRRKVDEDDMIKHTGNHVGQSKESEMGRLRLMPKMFALRAVQRQTAASRSTRPSRREQQGVALTKPLSTLAHTPSLSASRGQEPLGLGLGVGFGFGVGPGHDEKKMRFSVRKMAREEQALEAILN